MTAEPQQQMVKYWDNDSGRVCSIPARELSHTVSKVQVLRMPDDSEEHDVYVENNLLHKEKEAFVDRPMTHAEIAELQDIYGRISDVFDDTYQTFYESCMVGPDDFLRNWAVIAKAYSAVTGGKGKRAREWSRSEKRDIIQMCARYMAGSKTFEENMGTCLIVSLAPKDAASVFKRIAKVSERELFRIQIRNKSKKTLRSKKAGGRTMGRGKKGSGGEQEPG